MSEFACHCLNVQIQVPVSDQPSSTPTSNEEGGIFSGCRLSQICKEQQQQQQQLREQLLKDPFFALQTDQDHLENLARLVQWSRSLGAWAEGRKFPSLVRTRSIPSVIASESEIGKSPNSDFIGWEVVRCLLCEMDVWASRSSGRENEFYLLLNGRLLNKTAIGSAMASPKYSKALGILLSHTRQRGGIKSLDLDDSIMASNGFHHLEAGGGGIFGLNLGRSVAAQQITAACSDFLRREQEAMDERVRNFIEKEQSRFEILRTQAKADRDFLLMELQRRSLVDGVTNPSEVGGIGRQRSGGEESANDSAVPLSPISLVSIGDPSPGSYQRPKAYSNPATITHGRWSLDSAGAYAAGIGNAGLRGDQDVFVLDEEDVSNGLDPSCPIGTNSVRTSTENGSRGNIPPVADDESETDDSGTGEDYSRFLNNKMEDTDQKKAGQLLLMGGRPIAERTPGAGRLVPKFGKSLPVKVPCRFWPPKDAVGSEQASSSEDEDENTGGHIAVKLREEDEFDEDSRRNKHDVAEGMRKLARSIQAADDPERLFGERPRRRRYKTGDAVRIRSHAGTGAVQAKPIPADVFE